MRAVRVMGFVLGLAVPVLGGCAGSEGDAELPTFSPTSGSATSSTGTSTSATSSSTPSETPAEGTPAGVETTVNLAPGLTGEAKGAGEAYGQFWDFVGASLASPPMDVSKAGSFIAGEDLLSAVLSSTQQRTADDLLTRGAQELTVRSARVSGTTATLCATLRDETFEVTSKGGFGRPPVMETRTYKATMSFEGTSWRTKATEEVKTC